MRGHVSGTVRGTYIAHVSSFQLIPDPVYVVSNIIDNAYAHVCIIYANIYDCTKSDTILLNYKPQSTHKMIVQNTLFDGLFPGTVRTLSRAFLVHLL